MPGQARNGGWKAPADEVSQNHKVTTMKGTSNVHSFYSIFLRTYLVQAPR